MKKILAPSILAGDHACLRDSLLLADQDGREWIHLDVMDGHFVPNLSFGPQTVADLREHSSMFFDVHLMLDNPQDHIDSFVLAGADLISIHVEPEYEIAEALSKIKSLGKKCGIVLNPDTPAEEASPYLDQVDLVLCMTVNPGFGGQGFIEGVLSKVRDLADRRAESGASFLLEVDGGVGLDQVDDCVRAGVDVLVAGTAYFGADSQTRARFASSVENRGESELSS
ncbi:MAG TPA: ribulose-phosphate 3-epimerase [Opitutae bacterium]|nr:ribulose-phosphate 3-epimerase [Opitutae bacterium]